VLNLRYGAAAFVLLAACNQGGNANAGNVSDNSAQATAPAGERPFTVANVADLNAP